MSEDEEIKAEIEETEKALADLRREFLAEVAKWDGGGPPRPAVDAWTKILRICDRLVTLREQEADS